MYKIIPLIAAGALAVSLPVIAWADEPMESSPAGQAALQESQTTVSELPDGSKVEIAPDKTVWTFNHDGTKTVPSDGSLTLKDGTVITIKDGKKV